MPSLALFFIMKIRIGNDIRLLVKIVKGGSQIVNIHSVKVYIVNSALEAKRIEDFNKKSKFFRRFPIEPAVDGYTPDEYHVHGAGHPSYRAFPYNGFGYNPKWDKIYKRPHHDLNEFVAPVRSTADRDTVEVFFPASAQLSVGDYKIIVVAKLYEPGYSPNNLRTVTTDYENVFTLVSTSEEGTDSPVTLNINGTEDSGEEPEPGDTVDIHAESGTFNKANGLVDIVLNNGDSFNIDLSDEILWYEGD